MQTGKTSTFTIHHDTCKPATWTPRDVLALADFVRSGDIRYAGHLSRLGVQLVLSEHHVPKGGELQEIGFAKPDNPPEIVSDDPSEVADGEDVVELVRIYRGPVEYAARYLEGDGDGGIAGECFEFKPTRAEAEAFLASMQEPEAADTPA